MDENNNTNTIIDLKKVDTDISISLHQTFETWEEFHDFIVKYRQATAQPLIKGAGLTTKYMNSQIKGNAVRFPETEDIRYASITYLCKHYPRPALKKSRRYRTSSEQNLNNCPVKIRAYYNRSKKLIEIRTLELVHTHPLGQFWNYYGNLENRRLSPEEQEKLASMDLSHQELVEYANKHMNLKLTWNQLRCMRRRVRIRLKTLGKDKEESTTQCLEEKEEKKKDATSLQNLSSKETDPRTTASCVTSEKDINYGLGLMKEAKCGEGSKANVLCSQNNKVINSTDAKGQSCNKDTIVTESSNHIHKDKNKRVVSECKKGENDLVTSRTNSVSVDKDVRNSLKRKVIEISDDDDDTSPHVHVDKKVKAKVADDNDVVFDVNQNGEFNTTTETLNLNKKVCKLSKIKNDQDCNMKEQDYSRLLKSTDVEIDLNVNNDKDCAGNSYENKNTLDDIGTKDRAKTKLTKDVNETCLNNNSNKDKTVESDKIDVILVDDDSDVDKDDNMVSKERHQEEEVRIKRKKKRKEDKLKEKENDDRHMEIEENHDNCDVNKESTEDEDVVRKKKKKRKRDDRVDEKDEENVELEVKVREKNRCEADDLEDRLVRNGNVRRDSITINTNDVILICDESDSDNNLVRKERREEVRIKRKKKRKKGNLKEKESDENNMKSKENDDNCDVNKENTEDKDVVRRKKKKKRKRDEKDDEKDEENIKVKCIEKNHCEADDLEDRLVGDNLVNKGSFTRDMINKKDVILIGEESDSDQCLGNKENSGEDIIIKIKKKKRRKEKKSEVENGVVENKLCHENRETKRKKKNNKKMNRDVMFDIEENELNENCLRHENISRTKTDAINDYCIDNSPCNVNTEIKSKRKKKKRKSRDVDMEEMGKNGTYLRNENITCGPNSEKDIILVDDEETERKNDNNNNRDDSTINEDEEEEESFTNENMLSNVLRDDHLKKEKTRDSICEQSEGSGDVDAFKVKRKKKSKKDVVRIAYDEKDNEENLVMNSEEIVVTRTKKKKKKKETALISDENDIEETSYKNGQIKLKPNKKKKGYLRSDEKDLI